MSLMTQSPSGDWVMETSLCVLGASVVNVILHEADDARKVQ